MTELECELCPLTVAFREGGQFLSLPLYFSSTSYFGPLLHTHCRR